MLARRARWGVVLLGRALLMLGGILVFLVMVLLVLLPVGFVAEYGWFEAQQWRYQRLFDRLAHNGTSFGQAQAVVRGKGGSDLTVCQRWQFGDHCAEPRAARPSCLAVGAVRRGCTKEDAGQRDYSATLSVRRQGVLVSCVMAVVLRFDQADRLLQADVGEQCEGP